MSALPVVLSHNLLCLILCTEGTTFMKIGNNFCTDSRSCLYFTQSCHTSLWDKIVLNGVKPHKAVGVRQSDTLWGAEAAFLMGIKTLSIYFASLENHFNKYRLEIPTLPTPPWDFSGHWDQYMRCWESLWRMSRTKSEKNISIPDCSGHPSRLKRLWASACLYLDLSVYCEQRI